MSLLVHYTLKSPDDHDHQRQAMATLAAALKAEGVPVQYNGFATDVPTAFIGVLEFADQAAFQAFQDSAAFAAYKGRVAPTFANPPQTTPISAVAATGDGS